MKPGSISIGAGFFSYFILILRPILSVVDVVMLFRRQMADTEVPYLRARAKSVSPDLIVCHVASSEVSESAAALCPLCPVEVPFPGAETDDPAFAVPGAPANDGI